MIYINQDRRYHDEINPFPVIPEQQQNNNGWDNKMESDMNDKQIPEKPEFSIPD